MEAVVHLKHGGDGLCLRRTRERIVGPAKCGTSRAPRHSRGQASSTLTVTLCPRGVSTCPLRRLISPRPHTLRRQGGSVMSVLLPASRREPILLGAAMVGQCLGRRPALTVPFRTAGDEFGTAAVLPFLCFLRRRCAAASVSAVADVVCGACKTLCFASCKGAWSALPRARAREKQSSMKFNHSGKPQQKSLRHNDSST